MAPYPDPCPNCGRSHTYGHSSNSVVVYSFAADPAPRFPDLFPPGTETKHARSLRLSREAIRSARGSSPVPLARALHDRPTRRGRACGSRHLVMLG